ncbi:hypothetical protein CRUP_024743 [Coryphaenoides rupestris]|nr:hypothetical protein CRUP_024743 [Coryphaenoides rupestris]
MTPPGQPVKGSPARPGPALDPRPGPGPSPGALAQPPPGLTGRCVPNVLELRVPGFERPSPGVARGSRATRRLLRGLQLADSSPERDDLLFLLLHALLQPICLAVGLAAGSLLVSCVTYLPRTGQRRQKESGTRPSRSSLRVSARSISVPKGQTKVSDPDLPVMTMKEDIPGLEKNTPSF